MADTRRTLTYTVNKLQFVWQITSKDVDILLCEDDVPALLVGKVTATPPQFDQESFEIHCDWFLAAGTSDAMGKIEDAVTAWDEDKPFRLDDNAKWCEEDVPFLMLIRDICKGAHGG